MEQWIDLFDAFGHVAEDIAAMIAVVALIRYGFSTPENEKARWRDFLFFMIIAISLDAGDAAFHVKRIDKICDRMIERLTDKPARTAASGGAELEGAAVPSQASSSADSKPHQPR